MEVDVDFVGGWVAWKSSVLWERIPSNDECVISTLFRCEYRGEGE